jgi:hypothetical protein
MVSVCLFLFFVMYHYHIGAIAELRVMIEEKWKMKTKGGEVGVREGEGRREMVVTGEEEKKGEDVESTDV